MLHFRDSGDNKITSPFDNCADITNNKNVDCEEGLEMKGKRKGVRGKDGGGGGGWMREKRGKECRKGRGKEGEEVSFREE